METLWANNDKTFKEVYEQNNAYGKLVREIIICVYFLIETSSPYHNPFERVNSKFVYVFLMNQLLY